MVLAVCTAPYYASLATTGVTKINCRYLVRIGRPNGVRVFGPSQHKSSFRGNGAGVVNRQLVTVEPWCTHTCSVDESTQKGSRRTSWMKREMDNGTELKCTDTHLAPRVTW